MSKIISPAEAAQELLARKRARTSLDGFAEYSLKVKPALHHRVICEHIQRLIQEDEWDELIILAPPGSAKSYYTSIALPPFAIGTSPTPINVLTCSYSTELAERWSRKIRGLMQQEEISALWPNIQLSKESAAAGRWATERGDELYAAGVGSGILGFRADLGVIDDPISGFEEASSMTQLAKVHSWYETDFITRLKPRAKVVLICQRLAPNDLAGYLIKRNLENPTRRQKILRIPMEAGEDDVLGRMPGEMLWPEWYTENMLEDAKRDEFKWKTLYQQEPPSEEGSWVGPDQIQFRPSPTLTKETACYGMTDLALSVNSGDYTVHMVVAIDQHNDWDILDVYRKRVDPEESSTEMVRLSATYKPREWLIDDDNASKVYVNLVATKSKEQSIYVPWKKMPMRGQDKETRAAALRGQFKRRKVYMPQDAPFKKWLVEELLAFPNAIGQGVDDGVDALGLLGRRMMALGHTSAKVIPIGRKTIQQMCLDELWDTKPKPNQRM